MGFGTQLTKLKKALIKLDPSGHDGFEGLLAAIFSGITNKPFRLAGSGSQHGKDGSTLGGGGIAFEAKLYTGKLNKNEVLSKLTELIAAHPPPDLWVLGATIEIKTQITDPLTRTTGKNGINLLILDWSPASAIPELAVACALARKETVAFLQAHLADPALVADAATALDAVAGHEKFGSLAERTLAFLRYPGLGPSVATDANRAWLARSFSDERLARREFGQALAPLASNALPTIARDALVEQVRDLSFGPPEDQIVVLVGDEGCGKSWVFAQSWAAADDAPLALVIPAAEVHQGLTLGDERDFIIHQIIRQTGGHADQPAITRWGTILDQWQDEGPPPKPNLVVLVDGLNQRPAFAWGRWLDAMAYHLAKLGGRLVISVRSGYYATRLRETLGTPQQRIQVERWSEAELQAILAREQIDARTLSARVVAILRNPRLLGIAFELLREGSVSNFDELSVERLLFEHIRKSSWFQQAPEEPLIFTRRLSRHAGEIIERVRNSQTNDTLVFESTDLSPRASHELSQDLLAVSEGRFFSPLSDDPYMYQLSDDGLVMALGFAILDTLTRAERSGANPGETLGAMLEPIGALDKTAEAVFAAMLISSVDDRSQAATGDLIAAYLRLQNLDEQNYTAFKAIVQQRTDAAMAALAELTVSPSHAANDEWLTQALDELRHDECCWAAMGEHIAQWLRCYSLDPTLSVFRNDAQGAEHYEAKVAERRTLVSERLAGLSGLERAFLDATMRHDDRLANGALARQAFRLLAGKPLAGFAEPLVAWAFGQAINSDFHRPYDEFIDLVRFNGVDWCETREMLLHHAGPLSRAEASGTGQWALVHVLRATGTIPDADQCESLVEELTRDRPTLAGWRLIEKYCATDPCDPTSAAPDNIAGTAREYRQLDPEKLGLSRGMSQQDHFFRDASFGLARFEPAAAIEVHRAVIAHVSRTVAGARVYRMLNLRADTALVTAQALEDLLALARDNSGPHKAGDRHTRDSWLIAQYALLLAFPHMDGSAQLETLLSLPDFGAPLLDLADVMKPATGTQLEDALERCVQSDDANFRLTILMFAQYSGTELTARSVALLRRLTEDAKSSVRALAIGTLVDHGDEGSLRSFAESGWDANALDPHDAHFERWEVARAIAQAVSLGFLTEVDAIERIAPEHYHLLAAALAGNEASAIPERVNAALLKTLHVDAPEGAPSVDQETADPRKAFVAPMRSLAEQEENLGPEEFFKRLSEEDDEFDARQKRGWKAFEAFEASLTKQQARQILQDTPRATITACAASRPDLLDGWARTFLGLSGHKIRNIYNFGLRLADVLSHTDPDLSAVLFAHLQNNRGFINIVHGPASLGLESLSIWNAADHPALDALRWSRLDRAKTDNEIAQEVLAAISAGKEHALGRYVDERIAAERPADVARGLMVCGFSMQSERNTGILAAHADLPGLIGKAAQTACYAYERNVWARHWYHEMRAARTPEDFWRFSVLFEKIVDGRYQCWDHEAAEPGTPMASFAPSLWHEIKRRIKAWQDKRAKTLFDGKAPSPDFLAAPRTERC